MYKNYEERLRMIERRIAPILEKEYGSLRHLILSICVQRYFPTVDQGEIDTLVRNVLINQSFAWEEQGDLELLDKVTVKGLGIDEPTIYVSFHMSSYRLCLLYLLTKGKKIALLASREVISTQFSEINAIHNNVTGNPINVIDANAHNSLYQIREYLRTGYSIFVYLDGNTGTDGMTIANKHLIEIDFLSSHLLVRQGIPAIAYLCNVGLTPVICSRDKETQIPYINIGETIRVNPYERREEYVYRSLSTLYSLLGNIVRNNPDAWEAWLYIYKFAYRKSLSVLKPDDTEQKLKNIGVLSFNEKEYCLFDGEDEFLMISRSSLQAYDLKHLRGVNLRNRLEIETLSPDDLKALITRKILV